MKNSWCLLFVILCSVPVSAQKIKTFSLHLPAAVEGTALPVSIDLDSLTNAPAHSLVLFETSKGKPRQINIQVSEEEKRRRLYWIIDGHRQPGKITYRLHRKPGTATASPIKAEKKDGALVISTPEKDLLHYQFETVYPPQGVDSVFKRSGFIHPVKTPHGQTLTRIQPPDHYHHFGIWNPWTHTLFEQDTIDFWNLYAKKGTVRFAKFERISDGPVFAEFQALHEHIVFKEYPAGKTALHEWQTVRVYNPGNQDHYIVDITSTLRCASESPLLILAYRYGGLGWRATEFWDKNNSEMLTSEGKTRDSTDGTKARWCIVYGKLPDNDSGGIALLSHPSNYNHPEPLRIWDKNANWGRGDVFANFAPTKDRDWLLEPGKTYTLKYRLVVFNGEMSARQAESHWRSFASPAGL